MTDHYAHLYALRGASLRCRRISDLIVAFRPLVPRGNSAWRDVCVIKVLIREAPTTLVPKNCYRAQLRRGACGCCRIPTRVRVLRRCFRIAVARKEEVWPNESWLGCIRSKTSVFVETKVLCSLCRTDRHRNSESLATCTGSSINTSTSSSQCPLARHAPGRAVLGGRERRAVSRFPDPSLQSGRDRSIPPFDQASRIWFLTLTVGHGGSRKSDWDS